MTVSPHTPSFHETPRGSIELPEGWRSADDDAFQVDPEVVRRKRIRLVIAGVAGLLIAAYVIGFPVWTAASHYSRGEEAMRNGLYTWAASEFDAAKVIVIPYRDARSRAETARRSAAAATAAVNEADATVAATTAELVKVTGLLEKRRPVEVLAAVKGIPKAGLKAAAAADPEVRKTISALTGDLVAAGGGAIKARRYRAAERYASAALVLGAPNPQAAAVIKKARTGQALNAKLADAREAARAKRWREALRLGLAVLAVDKKFPGAADIVADARRALKPKKKAAPAPTVVAPAPAPVTPVAPPAPPAPAPP